MAHTRRGDTKQTNHDAQIEKKAKALRKLGYEVFTNPNGEKNISVTRNGKKVYPDLVVLEDNNIVRIYEVETDDTATENEVPQWKLYSKGKSTFYLLVPKASLTKAKQLIKDNDIDAKVEGY